MLQGALSNVSLGTSDLLAYAMLIMVAILLLAGPAVLLFYRRKTRRTKAVLAPRQS